MTRKQRAHCSPEDCASDAGFLRRSNCQNVTTAVGIVRLISRKEGRSSPVCNQAVMDNSKPDLRTKMHRFNLPLLLHVATASRRLSFSLPLPRDPSTLCLSMILCLLYFILILSLSLLSASQAFQLDFSPISSFFPLISSFFC
jgi:hypothetical protein